jgi:phosphotriesterase-related protein
MPFVRTVLGDVDAAALGVTDAHEHLLIRGGLILQKEPDFRLDSVDKAVEEVRDFQRFGGQAVVECSPIGIGRDPDGLAAISRRTGVHVVAATGFHKARYYLDTHWRFRYTVEQAAELFVREIEHGMETGGYEGPVVERSAACAGIVKVATDYQLITPQARSAFEAAAIAHARTGCPVLTHTEMGTMALEQVRLLESLGVAPRHVVLSHVDRNADPGLHEALAETGAFLQYDGPGRVKYMPESTVVMLVRHLVDRGLGGQLVIGGDTARRSYWKAYGGGPGMAYFVEHFVPRLRREGVAEEAIDAILRGNPARAFAFAERPQHA